MMSNPTNPEIKDPIRILFFCAQAPVDPGPAGKVNLHTVQLDIPLILKSPDGVVFWVVQFDFNPEIQGVTGDRGSRLCSLTSPQLRALGACMRSN